jgi:dihydroorotase-like cyclic amidohydrolase
MITAEVCIHHLWFYQTKIMKTKGNFNQMESSQLKQPTDREALWESLVK